MLKRFTLFDLVSAPKITQAARFCSLRILVKLSAEQFDQIVDPYSITCFFLSSLVSFYLNSYMLRNRHSIVPLVLILCCAFCILIRNGPFVYYYPLFSVQPVM